MWVTKCVCVHACVHTHAHEHDIIKGLIDLFWGCCFDSCEVIWKHFLFFLWEKEIGGTSSYWGKDLSRNGTVPKSYVMMQVERKGIGAEKKDHNSVLGLEIAWWPGGHWTRLWDWTQALAWFRRMASFPMTRELWVMLHARGKCDLWLEWNPWLLWVLQWLRMKVKFFNNFQQHTRILGEELLFSNCWSFFQWTGCWLTHLAS